MRIPHSAIPRPWLLMPRPAQSPRHPLLLSNPRQRPRLAPKEVRGRRVPWKEIRWRRLPRRQKLPQKKDPTPDPRPKQRPKQRQQQRQQQRLPFPAAKPRQRHPPHPVPGPRQNHSRRNLQRKKERKGNIVTWGKILFGRRCIRFLGICSLYLDCFLGVYVDYFIWYGYLNLRFTPPLGSVDMMRSSRGRLAKQPGESNWVTNIYYLVHIYTWHMITCLLCVSHFLSFFDAFSRHPRWVMNHGPRDHWYVQKLMKKYGLWIRFAQHEIWDGSTRIWI